MIQKLVDHPLIANAESSLIFSRKFSRFSDIYHTLHFFWLLKEWNPSPSPSFELYSPPVNSVNLKSSICNQSVIWTISWCSTLYGDYLYTYKLKLRNQFYKCWVIYLIFIVFAGAVVDFSAVCVLVTLCLFSTSAGEYQGFANLARFGWTNQTPDTGGPGVFPAYRHEEHSILTSSCEEISLFKEIYFLGTKKQALWSNFI